MLDWLVVFFLEYGVLGVKLIGGGCGGCMIVLIDNKKIV